MEMRRGHPPDREAEETTWLPGGRQRPARQCDVVMYGAGAAGCAAAAVVAKLACQVPLSGPRDDRRPRRGATAASPVQMRTRNK